MNRERPFRDVNSGTIRWFLGWSSWRIFHVWPFEAVLRVPRREALIELYLRARLDNVVAAIFDEEDDDDHCGETWPRGMI